MSIKVDPGTGLKIFNTRAAKSTDKIRGKGYSIIEDEGLKVLPEHPPGAVFNAEEQAKYRAFKEVRRGAADYMAMEGTFARYLEDVYSEPPVEREALTDECDILVVGAGFAGLLLWYKLSQAGFIDVRFCEKGGDVGGTWYWNRYPGIACDVESYSYLPLLEEMRYIPTMKFASGFEILEYCQTMADKFSFYDHCLFHTTVEKTEWDEESGRWTVYTDRGDEMKARFRSWSFAVSSPWPGRDRWLGNLSHRSRRFADEAVDLTRGLGLRPGLRSARTPSRRHGKSRTHLRHRR